MTESSQKSSISRLAWMLRFARPYRRSWIFILFLTLAFSPISLATPWPMLILVDHVLGSVPAPPWLATIKGILPGADSAYGMVAWVAVAGLGFFLLGALLDALLTLASFRVGQRMSFDLAQDLFARIQRRSLLFHGRNTVGDLLSRITGDSWCVYSIVDTLLLGPIRSIITLVLMIALMARMDWKLTLVALIAAPFIVGSSYWLGAPIRLAAKVRREVESRLLTHVQQTLSGIPVVQAFAQEDREQQRFREFADAAIGAQKRTTFAGQFHNLGTGLIAAIGSALVLWVGINHVLAGVITFGAVWVFLSYLGGMQEQFRALVTLNANIQSLSANADRVAEMMDPEGDVAEPLTAIALPRARGDVRFESVTFGYEPDRPVLRAIDLHVPVGGKLAIVGSSGAGKSTLAGLVPRFFDPWDGRILLDGRDVRQMKLRSLREQVAVVLQEPFLFPLTVAQNIAYGKPDATREQIEAAAQAAGAHEFILQMPQGYDSFLGEHGSGLSGGERQRISIARALLKDAPILILDEPTASLDAATEAGLLDALGRLMAGRTTLIIAHRLSTVRRADRIVVLDNGQIAEQGAHAELVAAGGIYCEMYETQIGRRRKPVTVES